MRSKPPPSRKTQILMTGIAIGESPRWHENRLWFSDWGLRRLLPSISPARARLKFAFRLAFHFVLIGCVMGACWVFQDGRGFCSAGSAMDRSAGPRWLRPTASR
jgi:hypothetical protein